MDNGVKTMIEDLLENITECTIYIVQINNYHSNIHYKYLCMSTCWDRINYRSFNTMRHRIS